MKIVVLDGYAENPGDLSWGALEALGELTVYDRAGGGGEAETIARIGEAEVVVTNKTPISRRVIDACPGMRFIALLATGYNVVDAAYAGERGIPVSNVPAYGTASVSQFSIALLLEICHHIGHHDASVHAGRWAACADWCYWDYPLIELEEKTMGVIGFGRIGQAEGRVARALGMRVLACDLHPCQAGREIAAYVETIGKMKDGVILINNARGQLINEQDVADALNSGKMAAAGLDVTATEPIREDNPLLKAKNCIITPHMSWGAKESRQRIMDCTAENVRAYLAGAPVNVVNG